MAHRVLAKQRLQKRYKIRQMIIIFTQALTILALAFVVLLVCWFGVNYLPVANTSVHTYTQY